MIELLLKQILNKKRGLEKSEKTKPYNVYNITNNKYVIEKIRVLHSKSTVEKTAILINKDIIAYMSDVSIDYEYDEEWLKQNNYDMQQIHKDFLNSLELLAT